MSALASWGFVGEGARQLTFDRATAAEGFAGGLDVPAEIFAAFAVAGLFAVMAGEPTDDAANQQDSAGQHDRVDETRLLDEEWHTLYVLLTGVRWDAPPPLGHVLLGTPALGRVVLGEGPWEGVPVYEDEELAELEVVPAARLTPGQVQEVARALGAVDPEALTSRIDPAELSARQVFPWKDFLADKKKRPCGQKQRPGQWFDAVTGDRIEEPNLPAFFAAQLAALRDFYDRAAQASRGEIQWSTGLGP